MGTYFYWGDGSIYLLGGCVEIFGGINTPIPPGFAPLVKTKLKVFFFNKQKLGDNENWIEHNFA